MLVGIIPAAALGPALRELGRGGYGVVNAHHLSRTVPTAVKSIHRDIVSEFNLRAFRREVDISCSLFHPNVVRAYGAVEAAPPLLVLELLLCSLHDLLHAFPRELTMRERLWLCAGVATGVAFLHSRDIVHADIRLVNVLLDERLGPKVSDMGTSRLMMAIGGRSAAEPVNGEYCAPERRGIGPARGDGVLAHPRAWDVYSLSVVFAEVLTGAAVVAGEWPAALAAVRPRGLRDAVAAAHSVDPAERPSAAELARAARDAGAEPAVAALPRPRGLARDAAGAPLRLVPRA
jgi:serine/threonine protein kinase